MALPDSIVQSQGTAVIWGEAGATGISLTVTKTLTFEGLASGSARQGASADLGANWNREYLVQLIIESGTAPTEGGAIDLYFACSLDNTNWPAGVTGSDGVWPTDASGNEDEWAKQLGPPVTSCIATSDANTVQKQQPVIWRPSGRYVAPIVDNNWSQAIRDETTATDNDSRVVLIPLNETIID